MDKLQALITIIKDNMNNLQHSILFGNSTGNVDEYPTIFSYQKQYQLLQKLLMTAELLQRDTSFDVNLSHDMTYINERMELIYQSMMKGPENA